MRLISAAVLSALLSSTLWAQDNQIVQSEQTIDVADSGTSPSPTAGGGIPPQVTGAPHPAATVYSHGYEVRRDIHKYASFATLPLFATEIALAQSLYNNPSSSKRSAHIAVGTGIIGLFGLNTVTGVWNLWEGRQDSEGKKLRLAHGILMMAAEAGFAATAATGPHGAEGRRFAAAVQDNRATHRAIALSSIGVGTASYLIMLFGKN